MSQVAHRLPQRCRTYSCSRPARTIHALAGSRTGNAAIHGRSAMLNGAYTCSAELTHDSSKSQLVMSANQIRQPVSWNQTLHHYNTDYTHINTCTDFNNTLYYLQQLQQCVVCPTWCTQLAVAATGDGYSKLCSITTIRLEIHFHSLHSSFICLSHGQMRFGTQLTNEPM